jgi:hypothetical protein
VRPILSLSRKMHMESSHTAGCSVQWRLSLSKYYISQLYLWNLLTRVRRYVQFPARLFEPSHRPIDGGLSEKVPKVRLYSTQ